MMRSRSGGVLRGTAALVIGSVLVLGAGVVPPATGVRADTVTVANEAPAEVLDGQATYLGARSGSAPLQVDLGLALRNQAELQALIDTQAQTHQVLDRATYLARYAPDPATVQAVETWAQSQGLSLGYVSPDGLIVSVGGTTAQMDAAFGVQVNNYQTPTATYYAPDRNPTVPAGLGIDSVVGLDDTVRAVSTIEHGGHRLAGRTVTPNNNKIGSWAIPGQYYPADLRQMYDVTAHSGSGTGQTIGIVLWGNPLPQSDLTGFANLTGDTAMTIDGTTACASSACSVPAVAADHVRYAEFGSVSGTGAQLELALDMEYSHGLAPGSGLKVFLGGTGSGTDISTAMAAAANDPSISIVSDSWNTTFAACDTGDTECATIAPSVHQENQTLMAAAAQGKTFYFSSGDTGTSGLRSVDSIGTPTMPPSSPYVVSVGGTALFDTANTGYSTETVWSSRLADGSGNGSGGGSGCGPFAQPTWQAGITNSTCGLRAYPDVSAIGDSNTGVAIYVGGSESDGVGGTSLAAPVVAGMAVDTQHFLNQQTFPNSQHPGMGFAAPTIYQLGAQTASYHAYFHDITCGTTAWPENGVNGALAGKGWDPASGWGSEDWFNYSEGYAAALGATSVTAPTGSAPSLNYGCRQTPTNAQINSVTCPTTSTCYAAADQTPATYFSATGSGGLLKSTDGGLNWQYLNPDLGAVACTSSSVCLATGDGGRVRRSTNADSATPTWTDASAPTTETLTGIACPSSTVCYVSGTGGTILKSTDGGQSWSQQHSAVGGELNGIACPSVTECLAVSYDYGQVTVTTDGTHWAVVTGATSANGTSQAWNAIACTDTNHCYIAGNKEVIASTSNASAGAASTWSTVENAVGSNLYAIACPNSAQVLCVAAGAGGTVLTTTNGTSWTARTSGTTSDLHSLVCFTGTATTCKAAGSGGTVTTSANGGTSWAASATGAGADLFGIACTPVGAQYSCQTVGQRGTLLQLPAGGTWHLLAGSDASQSLNAVSCTSATVCWAAGIGGVILATTNGGTTWRAATTGTTNDLYGISCAAGACVAVGNSDIVVYTTDGTTWHTDSIGFGIFNALAVSCRPTTPLTCVATTEDDTIQTTADGGQTWSQASTTLPEPGNGISCPAGLTVSTTVCFIAGASGFLAVTPNGGTTVTPATWNSSAYSNGAPDLYSVSCSDATHCLATGAAGVMLATADGVTWTQEYNPFSGPATALNFDFYPGNAPNYIQPALPAAACKADATCLAGGEHGAIMAPAAGATAARVSRFTVSRRGADLTFRWRLGARTGVLGFQLLAGPHRLLAHPLLADRRTSYHVTVRSARSGPYRLRVLLNGGGRQTITG